jgi:hypothetical protein
MSDLTVLRLQAIAIWESDVLWSGLTSQTCNGIKM